jgi:hypothetical protein
MSSANGARATTSPSPLIVSSPPFAVKAGANSQAKTDKADTNKKPNGARHTIEEAANLICDVRTLTKLYELEAADAAALAVTLASSYNTMCNQQNQQAAARERIYNDIFTTMRQECTVDKNVAAQYDRFVRKMEEAQTAMSDAHKWAIMIDATKSILLAKESSELSRELRYKIESLNAELRTTECEMMATKDKLVDMLFRSVAHCLEASNGAVKDEEPERK